MKPPNAILESLCHLVWISNGDGRLEHVNARLAEYAGVDHADAVASAIDGTSDGVWPSLVHAEENARVSLAWTAAIQRSTPFDAVARLRRARDGAYRWHVGRAEVALGEDGIARWYGTWTDVDDHRRELAFDGAGKGDFLAVLSHELRAPLHAILGWARELRVGVSELRRNHAVDAVERNARAHANLIEDLLDITRIGAGKLSIERKPVPLNRIVRSATDTFRPLFEARGVKFSVDVADAAVVVLGDSGRLAQVVTKVLSNALKFTAAGHRVSASLARSGGRAVLTVTDDGVGIRSEFLPHVFDPFRQADSSSTRARGGLGVGLAIVEHLVVLHGGAISVKSEGEGCGAVFCVDLPALPEGADLVAPERRPAVERDSAPSLRGVSVLVVDDEDDARELMLTALEQYGARVTGVGSAADARKAIAREAPHIIVSDVGMPGEDGYAFIQDLRQRPPYAGGAIPAIALTGYASIDDRRRAYAAGFDRHVAKPVDVDELARILVEVERTRRG